MDKYIINGGKTLSGEIKVAGAKNLGLKIIPAAILSQDKIKITNLPLINDINKEIELIEDLGAQTKLEGKDLEINPAKINKTELNPNFANKFRASIMFVGPILARFGEVKFPHPGGCVIGAGTRPIDIFLEAFQKMGAQLETGNNHYTLKAAKLKGINYFFHKISVTATESLLMTACLAQGKTVLQNCALEPEIKALADYLNKCGAKIKGAGTSTIEIEGVEKLNGSEIKIIPDRIETGTFAILAAATKSQFTITECNPEHISALLSLFDRIGIKYEQGDDFLKIFKSENLKSHDAITHEYPGFATDLQSPYTVLMTQTNGMSIIHETIYDRRLLWTDILAQMGANIIMADPHRIIVQGPTKLHGRQAVSTDLRAGIALVIAGLIAQGTTSLENIYQINRGYENIVERLQKLGADIRQVNE